MRAMLVMAGICSCCPPMQEKTTTPAPVVAPTPAVVTPPAEPAPPAGPPVARTAPVVDEVFGLTLPDPYRWMEGIGNAEHDAWLRAHGEHAATQLAQIPGRATLLARLRENGLGVSAVFNVQLAGTRMFHNTLPAGAQRAKLAVRERDGSIKVLIDPETLGADVSLNAWSPSPDGMHVAYVIARAGGERGELHVLDVATGRDRTEVIPRMWGERAGSWLDEKRFFYSQLAIAQPGVDPMLNMVTRLHVLGANPDDDPIILGRDPSATWALAPEEWPGAWVPRGSKYVLASAGGARAEFRLAIAKLSELDTSAASKTPWRTVGDYSDQIEGAFVRGDRLYVLTSKDAPNRRIVSMPAAAPVLAKAKVEIEQDIDATLVGMYPARDALYLLHRENGLARVSRWAWRGTPVRLALPAEGWTPDFAAELDHDGITFQIETWLRTGTYYTYDPKRKKLAPAGLASSTTLDTAPFVAEQVEVESFDGVDVPLTIISRKDRPAGTPQPTVITGYAAYGVSQNPGFGSSRMTWVERGGVWAICHARGGGEKGRRWKDGGSRENKAKGIDDFVACAEYLVEKGYAAKGKLAAIGYSMGGVLVGRAIIGRPSLFAAAWLGAPIVNPFRILAAENGANQKGELGDPTTEPGAHSIARVDPYLNVETGADYPAVLFTVGLNDHRVAPWMASKLAARLLAATGGKRPVLLRVDEAAGHGIGNTRDQVFAERADVYSFLLAQIGDPQFVAR